MCTQYSATHLDLLTGSDGTEHNLCKVLSGKDAETDATYDPVLLYQCQRMVLPVE